MVEIMNKKREKSSRARTLLEAIVWHQGEATLSKKHVLTFNTQERNALISFLNDI
jgi:CxxC motif-containing protein (DUF1111 family)